MQPPARQAEVGTANSGVDQGCRGCQYIGTYILGVVTIFPDIEFRDMVPDTAYTEGGVGIPQ